MFSFLVLAAWRSVTRGTTSPCARCVTTPAATGSWWQPAARLEPATCLTTQPPSFSPSLWLYGVRLRLYSWCSSWSFEALWSSWDVCLAECLSTQQVSGRGFHRTCFMKQGRVHCWTHKQSLWVFYEPLAIKRWDRCSWCNCPKMPSAVCLRSGSLHGALEETADASQLHLGPDWLWRRGRGESDPQIMMTLCIIFGKTAVFQPFCKVDDSLSGQGLKELVLLKSFSPVRSRLKTCFVHTCSAETPCISFCTVVLERLH